MANIKNLKSLDEIVWLKIKHGFKPFTISLGKEKSKAKNRNISLGHPEVIKLNTKKLTVTIVSWFTGSEFIYHGNIPAMRVSKIIALKLVNERKLKIIHEPKFISI